MRNIIFGFLILIVINSCSSNEISLADTNSNFQNQLKIYDKQIIKELSGTWRIYKNSFNPNEEPELVGKTDDEYIILKDDFTFKTRKGSGKISLAYTSIQSPEAESNFILSTYATYDSKTFWYSDNRFYKTYLISLNKNAKVRELKMSNFQDRNFKIFREE